MWDKRIIRGNTYAAEVLPSANQDSRPASATDFNASRRLDRLRKRGKRHNLQDAAFRRKKEEPVVPSHTYLEELPAPVTKGHATGADEGYEIGEEQEVQYAEKERGVDVSTWVGNLDLFDFAMAAEPVLQTLVGKSLDQSMIEVLQEEEMKKMKQQRISFENEQASTFTEAQCLENELKRGKEEVARRLAQANLKSAEGLDSDAALAARTTAKDYYENLQDTVLERLAVAGHFYDPMVSQIETSFMPWVVEAVARNLQNVKSMRENVDHALEGGIELGANEVEAKREADRLAAEAEKERLRLIEEEEMRIAKELEEQREKEELEKRLAAEAAALAAESGEGDDEGDDEE